MNVELQPFGREDFDRLIRWIDSPELMMIWSGISLQYPLDHFQLERYLASAQENLPVRHIYRVVQTGSQEVVGHVELNHIDRLSRAATLSRVFVAKPFRRQGVATEMIQKALGIGFDRLGLHRIDLVVFDFNQSAIACYQKIGFSMEGKLRDHRRMGDEYWSNYIMSILETEWHERGGENAA